LIFVGTWLTTEQLTHPCVNYFSTIVIAGISIPQKSAVLGIGGISVFLLMYLLSNIFWWTIFSSGFLIAVHAFLRDASMHKDMDDAMTMEGDLNLGEESSFLGSENA